MRSVLSMLVMTMLTAPCVFSAGVPTPDFILTSNQTMFDFRRAALAGSGIAVPGGILSVTQNPALLQAYVRERQLKGVVGGVGYGRDKLFTGHVVPVGAAYCNQELGTTGSVARYLNAGKDKVQYDGVFFYSGRLFANS